MDKSLFGRDYTVLVKLKRGNQKCRKARITEYRKYGDIVGQYVTNHRYHHTYDDWGDEVTKKSDGRILWTGYCPECEYCKEHMRLDNLDPILGFKIHPKNKYPHKK